MDPKNTPFLLKLLACVFAGQVLFMGYGALKCERLERCDRAADRIEQVFNVMIATTLSLLVGGKALSTTTPPATRTTSARTKREQ